MDIFAIWDDVLQHVQKKDPSFFHIFSNEMFPLSFSENHMVIAVTKQYLVLWLRTVYWKTLNEIITKKTGRPVQIEVRFMSAENMVSSDISPSSFPQKQEHAQLEEKKELFSQKDSDLPDFSNLQPKKMEEVKLPDINSVMNHPQDTLFPTPPSEDIPSPEKNISSVTDDEYTFENFVYGNCNEFAYQSALSVAKTATEPFSDSKLNPLFIYGPSGLGKTHLLHAISHYVHRHAPSLSVLFVTSETFTNDLIRAIRTQTTEKFRKKYRTVDFLLIDDVQFFGSKDATKMEIFNTFNDLFNNKKHIIMTSDRTPSDIEEFEDRLQSRFTGGLIVPISPPDFEICYIILQKRAEKEHIDLPDDVVKYIASHINTNIRELEGAFNKICTFSKIKNIPITLDFAKETLKDQIPFEDHHELNADDIIETVCRYFSVKKEKLIGKSRPKNIVIPRQIAMYLCRNNLDESFPVLAQYFQKKDHTTILHAYSKIEKELKEDKNLKKTVDSIQNELNKM